MPRRTKLPKAGHSNKPSSAGAKGKKARRPKTELRSLRKALADVPRKNEALQAPAVIIATGGNPTGIADTFGLPLTSLRPILCPVSGRSLATGGTQDVGWSARPRPLDAHP